MSLVLAIELANMKFTLEIQVQESSAAMKILKPTWQPFACFTAITIMNIYIMNNEFISYLNKYLPIAMVQGRKELQLVGHR